MKRAAFLSIMILMITMCSAHAYMIDGDISDWGINLANSDALKQGYLDTYLPYGGNDIDVITEDNADIYDNPNYNNPKWFVGPGWSYKNYYDAEALYFDNDQDYAYVVLVTGLTWYGKNTGSGHFDPGDLFFGFEDNSGSVEYSYGIDVSSYDKINKQAKFYDQITGWDSVIYGAHASANPWRLKISQGTFQQYIDFVYSLNQKSHYVLEARIPLSLFGVSAAPTDPEIPLWIHWTMESGNDVLNLSADITPTPEPASLLLLALGILGLRFKIRESL